MSRFSPEKLLGALISGGFLKNCRRGRQIAVARGGLPATI
jgi:hypothetical protein